MRILLVEDSRDLRHLFARLLRCKGFEVQEAADGREALDRLDEFEPDLVLTDLMMPNVDGFELVRCVRAMPRMDRVPVLVMTAAPSIEAEIAARDAGASGLMMKPIDSQTLLDRLGTFA